MKGFTISNLLFYNIVLGLSNYMTYANKFQVFPVPSFIHSQFDIFLITYYCYNFYKAAKPYQRNYTPFFYSPTKIKTIIILKYSIKINLDFKLKIKTTLKNEIPIHISIVEVITHNLLNYLFSELAFNILLNLSNLILKIDTYLSTSLKIGAKLSAVNFWNFKNS